METGQLIGMAGIVLGFGGATLFPVFTQIKSGRDSYNQMLAKGRYFSVIRDYPEAHQIILLK